MTKSMRFDNRVAIVTGAGHGLGRAHALALAARGAKVVVNDLGGARDGTGGSASPAQAVVREIEAMGGQALASMANVTDADAVEAMVAQAKARWGRVDILVNNAGILRDKTFAKMTLEDFRAVLEVHVMGAVTCTKAVWETMRAQAYGRIVMTSSSSGLYGNFGQANYGAAKMALVGLMNVLHLEGQKYDIRVNALAPVAATRMTEDLMPRAALDLVTPEAVTAGLLALVHEEAPSRAILCAGAGGYAQTLIYETEGVYLPPDQQSPEAVQAAMAQIGDPAGQKLFTHGGEQTMKFLGKAATGLGVALG
ncbi:MAG: SDR family NAD(P)-dependent oxidoreductase [Pseudomonadota bacterium]